MGSLGFMKLGSDQSFLAYNGTDIKSQLQLLLDGPFSFILMLASTKLLYKFKPWTFN